MFLSISCEGIKCESSGHRASGRSCIGVVFIGFIQISWVEGRELTLTKSEIYDYTFTACIMDGEDTLCPSYRLNHTVNLSLSIHEHPITE